MTASPARSLIDLSPSRIEVVKRVALLLAVVAVVASFAWRRYGWLDYRPGGAAFDSYISPGFIAFFIVAALIARGGRSSVERSQASPPLA